jgi:hypothetical protein
VNWQADPVDWAGRRKQLTRAGTAVLPETQFRRTDDGRRHRHDVLLASSIVVHSLFTGSGVEEAGTRSHR